MLSLPSSILREKNALYTNSAWLVLLDLLLSSTRKVYLVSNNENVTFSGRTYTAFPFELDQTKQSTEGDMPQLTLKIANATQILQGYIEELDGAVGSTVVIRVVNSKYLALDYSDLTLTYNIMELTCDAEWITATLGSENVLRRRFPPHRYIANRCNWEFGEIECAYSGSATTCGRSFEDCVALGNTARWGGFVGLSRKGWVTT